VWAKSNSWDSTLVTSNDGDGPLMKGFGQDGGEHEFIILNDGTFQQELGASGLVKAGFYGDCTSTPSVVRYFNNIAGPITITSSSPAVCNVDFGFSLSTRFWISQTVYNDPAFAKCSINSSNDYQLICHIYDWDGNHDADGGSFMILVY